MNTPPIGALKHDLDTPALCVDLEVMDANIRSMVDICREHGIDWRPHAKCHKSSAVGRRLVEAGAIGVTCAKLGEAEVMAAGGVSDLLIANLIVGPHKLARLVELRRQADPIVCVDHADQAHPLSQAMEEAGLTLRVLIEVDTGMARAGVPPGEPAVVLAKLIGSLPGLALAGLMAYEGHLLTIADPNEKKAKIYEAFDRVKETKQLIEQQAGIACDIVSCGGTGSYRHTVGHPVVSELQAGGAIFMDAFYRHQCQVTDLGYALTVLTTIVSRPTAERAIVDAGRKTLNTEVHTPLVAGRRDISVESLSAEHGELRLEPSAQDLKIGDRLELIPGYSDLTTVLHDRLYCFRDDRLEVVWPMEGRGRLQ